MKNKRFVVVYKEGFKQILLDKETRVQYLLIAAGYAASITPLLDKDGKPLLINENDMNNIKD